MSHIRTRRIRVQVPGSRVIDGIEVPTLRTETRTVPALPRDNEQLVTRGIATAVVLLLVAAIIWSTSSIAAVLGGGTTAYIAAGLFDASWIIVVGLAYLARYDEDRRRRVEGIGWGLLTVAVGALAWHGIEQHSLGLAVIGSAVSVVAKVLVGTLASVTIPRLAEEDQQWIAARRSEAAAQLAIAATQRKVARTQAHAAIQRAALDGELMRLGVAVTHDTPRVAVTQSVAQATRDALPDATQSPKKSRQSTPEQATKPPKKRASGAAPKSFNSSEEAVRFALGEVGGKVKPAVAWLAERDIRVSPQYAYKVAKAITKETAQEIAQESQETPAGVVPFRKSGN